MSCEEVRVHAYFSVKDESKLLPAAKQVVDSTQKEEGCLYFQLYKEVVLPDQQQSNNGKGEKTGPAGSKDDSSQFIRYAMIETWTSQKRLDAHSHTDHVAAFRETQKYNGLADVRVYTPVVW
ncbi:uncharacterized protein LOC142345759 [Convolutriloba macropyga]|uniref:uncharacterized protein LOC142345759 n=1 Tax=Convolutriloba macropyga TaxID=536237 RepID=UPI003F522C48